jgi:hypothetical protein
MKRVKPGDVVRVKLPYSEACTHLKVANQLREVRVLDNGAQILNEDGTHYSFPVTHGEAGVYQDAAGLYVDEPEEIAAKDLPIGMAVMFYDGQWHRTTKIVWAKGRKELRVYDSRGWSNVFQKEQKVTIDRSL